MLENIVFLALKRSGKSIYYYKNKFECDFVISQGHNISQAIQVTAHMNNEKTRNREIRGLIEAMDNYKLKTGIILTEDEDEVLQIEKNKIIITPVWKYLLEEGTS